MLSAISYVYVLFSLWFQCFCDLSGVTVEVTTSILPDFSCKFGWHKGRMREGNVNVERSFLIHIRVWRRGNNSCCICFTHQKFVHHFDLWQRLGLQADLFGHTVWILILMPWVPLSNPSSLCVLLDVSLYGYIWALLKGSVRSIYWAKIINPESHKTSQIISEI